jgi:ABC-2 type transport system ATP-binding protein
MAGLRKPTGGSIKLNGIETVRREARVHMGYLPERPYFHEHLTGQSFLGYMGVLSGLSEAEMRVRIPEVLRIVGLSHASGLELRRYSKGMLQRVGIAQALLADPEFLLLDEPMSGLDPIGRKEVRDLMERLTEQGKTVVFSSHIIHDVEAICQEVALLQKGKLVGHGPIGQFLAQGPLQTEIAFAGVQEDGLKKITAAHGELSGIPDGHRLIVSSQDQTAQVLSTLLGLGAKILWVNPIRPSLESLFTEKLT